MKLPKNRQSGQALVMALILLALGSLLVVPMLNQTFTGLKYHQLIECKTLNSYSADSGVEYVLCKLLNNPGGYTETRLEESFPLNDRTVNVTADYQSGGIYKITSTASGGGCGRMKITAYINLSAGAFAFVVAAKDHMRIESTTVDEGDIHSNWNIELVGTQVSGNASAVNEITMDDPESVTGTVRCPSPEITFPGDYSELYKAMAKGPSGDNIHDGDLTISEDRPLGPLYISGNLIVSGANVTLEGTVYVTGEIWVAFGRLEGEENVVAEGYINIEGGGYGSVETIPIITSINGDIKLEGPVVDAVIYAPNGHVWLEDVHLYGALAGKTVLVERSGITYAKELQGRQDLPGAGLHTIAYSYE